MDKEKGKRAEENEPSLWYIEESWGKSVEFNGKS